MNVASANKELSIRKRIATIYNKSQEDFSTLREYNDYLEEVEDIIFNLVEGVDVNETESKIAYYQEVNQDQILHAQAKEADRRASILREQFSLLNPDSSGGNPPPTTAGMGLIAKPVFMQPTPVYIDPNSASKSSGHSDENDALSSVERRKLAARAGGWSDDICTKRALNEAMAFLWTV